MNQLDVSPAFALPPSSNLNPEPAHRLIVLFPASAMDTPDLDHRIWEIARSMELKVLILSFVNNFEEETQVRRKLVTMAAVIKDPNVSTDIMIEYGNQWLKQVRKIWQAGDVVACYAGHKVGIFRKSLDEVLKSVIETPVVILSDYKPIKNPKQTIILQISSWLGSLAIIGFFLWVEMTIIRLSGDWTHTALIYVCVILELVLLILWNSLVV